MSCGSGANGHRSSVHATPDGRVTRKVAAVYLGYAPETLAMWQSVGKGPRSTLIGGKRFYYLTDLDAFIRGEPSK